MINAAPQRFVNYLVAIPAFNCASSLPSLIGRIRRHAPGVAILVVDDGSSDDTAAVARDLRVELIRHDRNLGKGAALRSAYAEASRRDVDAVVQIDADGQHDPEYIPSFFAAFETEQYDVIIGTRRFHDGMPWPRRLSNRVTSWTVTRMAGLPIADCQSGYRLIGRRAFTEVKPRADHFDFEAEFLILAGRSGLSIGAVPVSTIYRARSSFIRPVRDSLRFLRLVRGYWRTRPRSLRPCVEAPTRRIHAPAHSRVE